MSQPAQPWRRKARYHTDGNSASAFAALTPGSSSSTRSTTRRATAQRASRHLPRSPSRASPAPSSGHHRPLGGATAPSRPPQHLHQPTAHSASDLGVREGSRRRRRGALPPRSSKDWEQWRSARAMCRPTTSGSGSRCSALARGRRAHRTARTARVSTGRLRRDRCHLHQTHCSITGGRYLRLRCRLFCPTSGRATRHRAPLLVLSSHSSLPQLSPSRRRLHLSRRRLS